MYACGSYRSSGSARSTHGAAVPRDEGQTGQVEATPGERRGGLRERGARSGGPSRSEWWHHGQEGPKSLEWGWSHRCHAKDLGHCLFSGKPLKDTKGEETNSCLREIVLVADETKQ